jgi:AcrR family transcriptional regulator
MARPKGSRDRDYDLRRQSLIAMARAHLSTPAGRNASWRDLAAACQVSVSTMNHYFAGRAALIAAILEQAEQEGARYLAIAQTPSGPFDRSVADLVWMLSLGLQRGVLALQVIGLAEGFGDQSIGGAYLMHHLEPSLEAIGSRLRAHIAAGEMIECDTRLAALELLSPLLVAHLHQTALGGHEKFPLSISGFLDHHTAHFVRSYGKQALQPDQASSAPGT